MDRKQPVQERASDAPLRQAGSNWMGGQRRARPRRDRLPRPSLQSRRHSGRRRPHVRAGRR
eukprot:7335826-Alexandrium_andersonii.AAC.1